MKNILLRTTALTLLSSSLVLASGWRIPEQSASSVALAGAYVANASGAEASYFNPANMSFNQDAHLSELSLMYIGLTSINYEDSRSSLYDSKSQTESFVIPTTFLSSKDYDGVRYGLSVTAPGGLSKRWDSPFAKTSAHEFSLRIIELNPVVSYLVSPKFSIGGGLRVIYSDGIVKSSGMIDANRDGIPETHIQRDMEGDTIEFGYNLALTYKPTELSNIAVTYRSDISLKEKGTAKLYYNGTKSYSGSSGVEVPLPAVLSVAFSHKFDKTTVELTYDKTYWSTYKELDFNYGDTITNPVLNAVFDDPKDKNWKDTNAYRIGVSYEYNDKLTLMAGFAIDENPAPKATTGFELPDSDAKLYSIGLNYKLDEKSSIGFGYLVDIKDSIKIDDNDSQIDGTFSNGKAHLLSFAYRTTF